MGGQLCCNLEQTTNKFRGDLYRFQAFELVDTLSNDPLVQKWMAENKEQEGEAQFVREKKFLKLKTNDVYYYCPWLQSLAEGKGFVYKPGVLFFDGCFHKGVPEGPATVKFLTQQCEYKGQVKSWRAHGKGSLHNNKGHYTIMGNWQNSRLKSASIEFEQDQNIKKVQIDSFDARKGSIQYQDGRWYEGTLDTRKLEPHGIGKVNFPIKSNKNYYEGQWYKGQITGKGKLIYRNKSFYEGQFFTGLKQGFGRFTYETGQYFQGYWHKGKQLGVGALYSILGETIKYGMWENGKLKQQLSKQKWQQISEIERSKHSKGLEEQQKILNSVDEDSELRIKMTDSKYY